MASNNRITKFICLHKLYIQIKSLVQNVMSECFISFNFVFFVWRKDSPCKCIFVGKRTVRSKGRWKISEAGKWNGLNWNKIQDFIKNVSSNLEKKKICENEEQKVKIQK